MKRKKIQKFVPAAIAKHKYSHNNRNMKNSHLFSWSVCRDLLIQVFYQTIIMQKIIHKSFLYAEKERGIRVNSSCQIIVFSYLYYLRLQIQ